jgi:outer membrane biosynthesis protein TonB
MRITAILLFLLLSTSFKIYSQTAARYFDESAHMYVDNKPQQALQKITEGLTKYPNDPQLKALAEKIKEEKKQEEQEKQEQEQKEQEQKDQQKKDQEKKENEKKEGQDKEKKSDQEKSEEEQKKEDQQKKEEQQKDPEKKNEEKKETPPSVSEKLQQMKISEEKAKMLLEAMKNQEVQYLQQNKRKATKPKEKGKPDW